MKARTRRVISGLLLISLAVVVVLATAARLFQHRELLRRQAEERADLRPRPLVTATVQPRDLARQRRLLVRLEPWRESLVSSELPGVVREISAEPGDPFAQGEILAQLDDTLARRELEAARVELREANRLLEEALKLGAQRVVSPTELAARRAAAEAAAARVALLEARLEKHAVRAPFDGLVRARRVQAGEAVNPGQPLVEFVQISPLRGVLNVSEEELPAFRRGAELEVLITNPNILRLRGQVTHIAPAADPATRLYRVELELPQPQNSKVLAGTIAETRVKIALWQNVPAVPEAAVRWRGNTALVEVLAGQEGTATVTQKRVELGPLVDGFYPVLDGLQTGERVILR